MIMYQSQFNMVDCFYQLAAHQLGLFDLTFINTP